MIDWWGPIILEYYGATEGMGMTVCDSAEWLAHPGTVGKTLLGEVHVLDEDYREVSLGQTGKIWFKTAYPFEYFSDPIKTAEANSPDRTMSTVGDIGHVDEDGYVYLTDRTAFMIISGGVNIYPQESENVLVTHPKVADAAVFGVPNEEMGEEVKAIVQLMPGFAAGAEMEAELIAFSRDHLAHHKCPRSIDFEAELPRLPTGKLYKGPLRERYWTGRQGRIVSAQAPESAATRQRRRSAGAQGLRHSRAASPPAGEAEPSEADQDHRPGRGLWHERGISRPG